MRRLRIALIPHVHRADNDCREYGNGHETSGVVEAAGRRESGRRDEQRASYWVL
jgi:hypothetical protein